MVADFKVSLPLAMWSQDTCGSASLLFPFFLIYLEQNMYELYFGNSFFPINSDTTVLKVNHFLPWKCPVSFYPFSFKLRNSLTQTLTLSKISATTIQVFRIQVQSTSGKDYFSLLPSKIRKIYFYLQNPEQSHICISYRIYPSWSFQLLMCFSIDKRQNKSGFLKRGSSISHSEKESQNLIWAALWYLKLTGKKEFSWTPNFFLSCLRVLQKKFHRKL